MFSTANYTKVLELLDDFIKSNIPKESQKEWVETAMRLLLLEHNGDEETALKVLEECSHSEQVMLALDKIVKSGIQGKQDIIASMRAAQDKISSALLAAIPQECKLKGYDEDMMRALMHRTLEKQLAVFQQDNEMAREYGDSMSEQGYQLVEDILHDLRARGVLLSVVGETIH